MLKQADPKSIIKVTIINVLGNKIKKIYVENETVPAFSCKDLVHVLYDDMHRLSNKDWDAWLEEFVACDKEYLLLGEQKFDNLFFPQNLLESMLLDIDYNNLDSKTIKRKRTVYTHIFLTPKEYSCDTEIKNEDNDRAFKCYLASLNSRKKTKSKYRGVRKIASGYAVLVYRRAPKYFKTIEEAAKEYDKQVYTKYGDKVIPYLNFPEVYSNKTNNVLLNKTKLENLTNQPDSSTEWLNNRISIDIKKYIDLKISEGLLDLIQKLKLVS